MPTPYAEYVNGRDPIAVLDDSLRDYRNARARLTAGDWSRPWAEGKWTVGQILVHVAQWEMIFGVRLRCALGVDGFVIQPVDQDDLMREAEAVDGPTAFATFEAVRGMNLALARNLSADERARAVQHAVRGEIDVNDLLTTLAGHPIHHLRQIEKVIGA
jgi:hypothetical protein